MNGRPGAAQGPARFMEYFLKLRGLRSVSNSLLASEMCSVGGDLEVNHRAGRELTEQQLRTLGFPGSRKKRAHLAVGGGHDWADPWVRGFVSVLGMKIRLGCINIDAHFDLREPRPLMSSGAPFRRLLEEKVLSPSRLVEFGIQSHCNAPELWEYARKNRIRTVTFEELREGKAVARFRSCLRELRKKVDVILISLDLDSVSLAHAPGVSAPQPEGFTPGEIYRMLEEAAGDPAVAGLGIFELAPPLDVQDHTSRLAAQCAWKFMNRKMEKLGVE